MSIQEVDELEKRFGEHFTIGKKFDGAAIHNSGDTVAVIRNWDKWADEINLTIDKIDKTPTGVTRELIGTTSHIVCYVFSSGNKPSYYKKENIEAMSEVLGYDMKSNLDKLSLMDTKDGVIVAEGDGFKGIIAPWLPPSSR